MSPLAFLWDSTYEKELQKKKRKVKNDLVKFTTLTIAKI